MKKGRHKLYIQYHSNFDKNYIYIYNYVYTGGKKDCKEYAKILNLITKILLVMRLWVIF